MAIVMLSNFYPGELPGEDPTTIYSIRDFATYHDVWNAVKQVKDNCISRYLAINQTMREPGGRVNFRSQTGWSAVGTMHRHKIFNDSFADIENVP